MRAITTTVVGAATGSTIPLDYGIAPFQVSVGVTVVSGAVNYKLQYTYDDVLLPGADTPTWWDSAIMVSKTAASDVVLNSGPVSAIRLVNADTGTIRARIIQAGLP